MSARGIARIAVAVAAGSVGLILTLPVVALLVPLWAVAALTRWLSRHVEPRPVPWRELIQFEPVVGWKPRGGLDAHALDFGGDTYQVTTDASGWRGRRTLEESDVVVLGDSYAFGCGVDDADFFADLPNDVRIKAIGCPAYSMVQPVLWIERLASRLAGKRVIWLVYLGNDLEDSLRPSLLEYRAPFVRSVHGTSRWEIVSGHVDASKWTLTYAEGGVTSFIDLCRPTHLSERVFSACEYLIERARNVCARAGAELVVMTVPDLSPVAQRALAGALAFSENGGAIDERVPDRRIREICERFGVEFVSLRDHLDSGDYLERDFHWSPRGHRRLAELIRGLHLERERHEPARSGRAHPSARPARSPVEA